MENDKLHLEGKATDHIWLMQDGKQPNVIGVRMDCGDSGTVYLTPSQAADLAEQLIAFNDALVGTCEDSETLHTQKQCVSTHQHWNSWRVA